MKNYKNECRCILDGFCPLITAKLVTDGELKNSEFIRDARGFAYTFGFDPSDWKQYLTDEYAAFQGVIKDERGCLVELDLQIFEVEDDALFTPSDEEESAKEVSLQNNRITNWFEDWCCTPCKPEAKPFVHKIAMERVRVLTTILRARNPGASFLWGVRAANDNEPQK